jgi:hypothetical protein
MGVMINLYLCVLMRDAEGVHTYTKGEWLRVARAIKPDLTEAAYDAMWDGFCECKAHALRELNT